MFSVFIFQILGFFWLVRTTKAILFWIYLWQLKSYHIGRFLDHFKTKKGMHLLFNKILGFKIALALMLFLGLSCFSFKILFLPDSISGISSYLFECLIWAPFLIIAIYFIEAIHASLAFIQGRFKKPVITKKTVLLISVALVLEILFIATIFSFIKDEMSEINFVFIALYFLLFDIFASAIATVIVFIFQPFIILGRRIIIQRAKSKRAKFGELLVIGITGSYGKTAVKEFLAEILAEKFQVLKTKFHENSEVGIARCILNDLKPEHEIFVCEMGAYSKGGIKLLRSIANPKIGILTGINEQHMSTFGSQENIIKAKYELMDNLPLAIFNGDNPACLELYKKTRGEKKVYGLQSSIAEVFTDVWAYNVKYDKDYLSFKVVDEDEIIDFKVNLFGSHNVLNILAAVAAAKEVGMNLEEIAMACRRFIPSQSGVVVKDGNDGINVIDATYSANPDGVMSHLEYLKLWQGKKIIIMPCLIELGKASKEVHQRIGNRIGETCDLAIITTQEHFPDIKKAAMESGLNEGRILFSENPKKILKTIQGFLTISQWSAGASKKGDVVLLESRVPKELIASLIKK